jgi:uncharacterized protein YndB with AHSA1/START domain
MSDSLTFQKFVKAEPDEVYHALSNSTRLREWMCDLATTDPKSGGRVYFAWFPGFYACGDFTLLEPARTVAFSWFGRGEIRPTQVTYTLAAQEGGTLVTLVHSGLGTGEDWDRIRKNFQHNWESALDNLASIMDTGRAMRIIHRPMLGIFFDDFNAEIAHKLGTPIPRASAEWCRGNCGSSRSPAQADDVWCEISDRAGTGDTSEAYRPATW